MAERVFKSDFSPPGDVIRLVLERLDIRPIELARATGLSAKHINQLLHNKARITPEVALSFEEALYDPGSWTFWAFTAEMWCEVQAAWDIQLLRDNTDYGG